MKPAPLKKILSPKKLAKTDREQALLFGLVELYLKTGKPIGSHTLQESGFDHLSSATIRNYFAKMESQGYLEQLHTSGGRVPTEKAFRLYADCHIASSTLEEAQEKALNQVFGTETREITTLLNRAAETLSELSRCAIFISAPRFDQDFIQDVRLLMLDQAKLLCVLITDFGQIKTETLFLEQGVKPQTLRTIEEYFFWRLNKGEKPLFESEEEGRLAQKIYNEIMVRHVVGYANFPEEDILRTGLSKLLAYPEFSDAAALGRSLSLLEDGNQMRSLLRECMKKEDVSAFIGNELSSFMPKDAGCAVIAIPYRINQTVAGSIALLGPMRLPYRNLFGLLRAFEAQLSRQLTESLYKYKITFREPSREWTKQLEVK